MFKHVGCNIVTIKVVIEIHVVSPKEYQVTLEHRMTVISKVHKELQWQKMPLTTSITVSYQIARTKSSMILICEKHR